MFRLLIVTFTIYFQASLMPATVAASRVPTFGPHLTAGSMYSITGFDAPLPDFVDTVSVMIVSS